MTDRRRLLLVNGSNLNLLGSREPQVHGTVTGVAAARRLARKHTP